MMGSPGFPAQGHVLVQFTAVVALSAIGWTFISEVGAATFWALGMGGKGTLID